MHEMPARTIGNGEVGGKARGLVQLAEALRSMGDVLHDIPGGSRVFLPETSFVTTSAYQEFLAHNGLVDAVHAAPNMDAAALDELVRRVATAPLPSALRDRLADLADVMEGPLVVRSSSLLEDRRGTSFAGKYESVFTSAGTVAARREGLFDAVRLIYASAINPSALAYRAKRGLMDEPEQMALVVQKVVGRPYKRWYLPALAGVAFSQNGYCWNREIAKKDGLVRLVFGLGTCAVGRGYVRMFSPVKPEMRPEGSEAMAIQKCSQRKVDVIDLDRGGLATINFRELISNGFDCYPGAQQMVSLRDGNYLYRPVSNLWDPSHVPMLTMDGVLAGTWMGLDLPGLMKRLFAELEGRLGYAVDIEFAIDVDPQENLASLYLVQARPLSEAVGGKVASLPVLSPDDILFTAHRNLPTAHVPDIEYMVYVDESRYHEWPYDDRHAVARVVGQVNEALKGKRFLLMGPGRWGSWNPLLGVPVSYAEIANCSMLAEVARRKATYIPEVSYGSHFFQDLIEDRIAYLPLNPDEPHVVFRDDIFSGDNALEQLLPDPYYRRYDDLIRVLRVGDRFGGRMAHAILDGAREEAVVFVR